MTQEYKHNHTKYFKEKSSWYMQLVKYDKQMKGIPTCHQVKRK